MGNEPASVDSAPKPEVDAAIFTVIIPAHNEASVIAKCLKSIYETAPSETALEVIVATNGCDDKTAEIARATAPTATVLELDKPSKSAAINQANAVASHYPRLIMDADVECDFASLRGVAAALRSGNCLAASPRMRLNLSNVTGHVRSYYKVWMALPYAQNGLIGGGVYGLSAKGGKRTFPLPHIIGDDLYVRTRFTREERCNLSHDSTGRTIYVTMTPPSNLRELVGIEARRRMGKHQVDRLYSTPETGAINHWQDLVSVVGKHASVVDLLIYLGVKSAAMVLFRFNLLIGRETWTRDTSSRAD
jgi:hypothetical protein